jgi:hypothetical protein
MRFRAGHSFVRFVLFKRSALYVSVLERPPVRLPVVPAGSVWPVLLVILIIPFILNVSVWPDLLIITITIDVLNLLVVVLRDDATNIPVG